MSPREEKQTSPITLVEIIMGKQVVSESASPVLSVRSPLTQGTDTAAKSVPLHVSH